MGREEVIEGAGEGERILGKREKDKRKERGDRERMNGRMDGHAWCYSVFGSSFSASAASSGVFSTCVMKRTNH